MLLISASKICCCCKLSKSLDAFHKNKSNEDGLQNQCRACASAYHKQRRGEINKRRRNAYAADPTTRLSSNKNHYKRHPEVYEQSSRKSNLKRYGISEEQYQEMLHRQGGVCAICKNNEISKVNGKFMRLGVDHNHSTGKIRELLCSNCNKGIGNLKEDIAILQAAIDYIQRHAEE